MRKELLYRFFSGEATVEEQREVLDWIEADPANMRELLAERRLFDAMLIHAAPCRGESRRKAFATPRWLRETVKYAAACLVAAGLAGAYFSDLRQRIAQSYNTISVPSGQCVDVTLPDGTKVCMNARSELKYPAYFIDGNRRVHLSGEAFFEVVRDERHPFVVETFACDVEVLGTKFDVRAHAENDDFSASLVEGRVRVTDRADSRNRVVLQPKEKVARRGGRLVVGRIPEHERFLWREGLIAFRDASFKELLGEFEKYFGVRIEMRRAKVTDKLFTGKIRISEGIDHALGVLQHSAAFKFTHNDTRDVIYIQ